MRKILFIITLLFSFLSVFGINKTFYSAEDTSLLSAPKIDKRVELLSIVFRLAGNTEYNGEEYKKYVNDIHNHFDKYKNHPLIAFAKELSDSDGIGYDAVMELAIHIGQPPALNSLVMFSDSVPEERWGANNATKFVALLQKFYVDAECGKFFKEEESTYKIAEEKFKIVYNQLDINWYKQYYGQVPDGKFNIVIGLGNGGSNYGCKIEFPDKREQIYAIMGTWSVDSNGQPRYNISDYFPTLVHEFNHSFVNFLIYKNKSLFEKAGSAIYEKVANNMRVQAYSNWTIMICEALVRASVIEYLKSHDTLGGKQAFKETIEQLNRGFVWIREQVTLLDKYENKRQKYPTLESYIPEIASFYNGIAKNIDSLIENYKKSCPHILSIVEFKNNDTNVSSSLKEISIKVDKALRGKGYSINYGKKGKDFFPAIGKIKYSDDNTIIIIPVEVKPQMEYQFILTGRAFTTPEGFPLEPFEVDFKTGK